MKKTKIFYFLIIFVLQIFVLAGCGDKETVIIWHPFGKENLNLIEEKLKVVAEKHNIKFQMEQKGDYKSLKDSINKALPAKNQPNIAFGYPDNVAEYNNIFFSDIDDKEIVLNLDRFIKGPNGYSNDEMKDFFPSFLDECQKFAKEGTWCLPFAKSTELLFYNKEIFDDLNFDKDSIGTWEKLFHVSKKIVDANKSSVALGYDSGANMIITMAEQLNKQYNNQNYIPYTGKIKGEYEITFGKKELNQKLAELLNNLLKKYTEKIFVTKSTTKDKKYTSNLFQDKEIAMTISSTAGFKYILKKDGKLPFDLDFAEIPFFHEDYKKAIQQGPNVFILNDKKYPHKNEKAWILVKTLLETENLADYGTKAGYLPSRKSSTESAIYKDFIAKNENPLLKNTNPREFYTAKILEFVRKKATNNALFASPAFGESASARDLIDATLTEILNNKDKYLDQITEIQSLLAKKASDAK